jgi:hypothetical protein
LLLEGTTRDLVEDDFYKRPLSYRDQQIAIEAVITGVHAYLPLCHERHRTKIANCVVDDSLSIRRVASLSPMTMEKLQLWQPESDEYGLPTGIESALKQFLPEVIFIEAFKDPTEEAQARASAVLGKLLKQIMEQVSDQVQDDVIQSLDQASRKLNVFEEDGSILDQRPEEIQRIEERIRLHFRELFDASDVRLSFSLPSVGDLMSSATLYMRDHGPWTSPEGKGQGFQRALYLALLQSLADEARYSEQRTLHRPFILLFEEPEAFLHPALQKQMALILNALSRSNQVLIATHSPLLVSPDSISSVLILRQESALQINPHSTSCTAPDFESLPDPQDKQLAALLRFSSSSEFLFSDCVLVVEGPSDRALLDASWAIHASGTPQQEPKTTLAVIEAGNKTVVPVWLHCLSAIGINAHGVVDLDFLWRGAGKCLGSDPELSSFCEEFWTLADIRGLSKQENGERDIPKASKRAAYQLVRDELLQQADRLCGRIRDEHGIWVFSQGEIETYFGLSESSKGRYTEVAQRIRIRDMQVHQEVRDLLAWATETNNSAMHSQIQSEAP